MNGYPFQKRYSLGVKVFIFYLVSMMLVVLVMGALSYQRAADTIKRQVGGFAQQTVGQTDKRMQYILDEYENRSWYLFGNKELQKGLVNEYRDNFEKSQTTNGIHEFLANLVNSKNDSVNIFLLGELGASFRYSTSFTTFENQYRQEAWYRELLEANGRVVFFGSRPSLIPPPEGEEQRIVFSFGRALKNLEHRTEIIGVLLYEVDPAEIRGILSEIDLNGNGKTMILDGNSRIIAASGEEKPQSEAVFKLSADSSEGHYYTRVDGRDTLIVYAKMKVQDWFLVGLAPSSNLTRDAGAIGGDILSLAAAVTFTAAIIAFIAARHLHRPVAALLRSMRKAREGDFQIQITDRRRDEFSLLFDNFNTMVRRIKELIDELYVQKLLKKELQFKMLGSQINAHFLYNTLDSIHWIARIHKIDEISTMIFGLSRYMRLSLSDGRDEVTLDEVTMLLDSYISIQKVRYQNKFDVEMRVEGDLRDVRVIKYIFQPLVENAIYHGLEKKKGPGKLGIRFFSEKDCLYFEVEDDGIGIPGDRLKELQELCDQAEIAGGKHFALKTISSQIKLVYGPGYGLTLHSELGRGTRIRMKLPLQ